MIRNRQAGFTLPELIVTVSVTTIMIMVITGFTIRALQTATLQSVKAQIIHEVQLTLDNVTTDVRLSASADAINRIGDNNSPLSPVNNYGWIANNSTMVLATAAKHTNGNIIFSDAANYISTKNNIVYFVSNGTLYKRTLAANVPNNAMKTSCPANRATASCPADKALLTNVTRFTVRYIDGDSNTVIPTNARAIEVSLTARANKYNQAQEASYTTRMVFRND